MFPAIIVIYIIKNKPKCALIMSFNGITINPFHATGNAYNIAPVLSKISLTSS